MKARSSEWVLGCEGADWQRVSAFHRNHDQSPVPTRPPRTEAADPILGQKSALSVGLMASVSIRVSLASRFRLQQVAGRWGAQMLVGLNRSVSEAT